eukprot:PhF_6_TR12580/c0_g1_i1/m.19782
MKSSTVNSKIAPATSPLDLIHLEETAFRVVLQTEETFVFARHVWVEEEIHRDEIIGIWREIDSMSSVIQQYNLICHELLCFESEECLNRYSVLWEEAQESLFLFSHSHSHWCSLTCVPILCGVFLWLSRQKHLETSKACCEKTPPRMFSQNRGNGPHGVAGRTTTTK